MRAAIAHGGGPTAVINASLGGLIEGCRKSGFSALYGVRFGVEGLLKEDWIDLLEQPSDLVRFVAKTPGSALGSSRRKLSDDDYDRILNSFRKHGIDCFFYTGGNGSMSTALEFARRGLNVIGIPKTLDNDLCETDHTPGYASTAHFFACAVRDIGEDNRSLPSPVCIVEVLGRNAGWVVAATHFARQHESDAPHLIYFPEAPVSLDQIAADVERVYRRLGRVVIAVCEGQRDEKGVPFGADVDRADSAVHQLASNLGHTLARQIQQKLGIRARAEKPGLLGRSCGDYATGLDRREAWRCGTAAAKWAAEGQFGVMAALRRIRDKPYRSEVFPTPLEQVARRERLLARDWINTEANDVAEGFIHYAAPLVPAPRAYPRFTERKV